MASARPRNFSDDEFAARQAAARAGAREAGIDALL